MEETKAIPEVRKRPRDDDSKNTPYYKLRATLRDMRPHFIEVLKTPDFRNCKAAADIREGLKIMMDLYKEMKSESVKLQKCSNGDVHSGDIKKEPLENHQEDVKPVVNPPPPPPPSWDGSVSPKSSEIDVQGTYIVGGSAFGWNFTMYHGNKAVYYGRTKEDFRAKNAPKTE